MATARGRQQGTPLSEALTEADTAVERNEGGTVWVNGGDWLPIGNKKSTLHPVNGEKSSSAALASQRQVSKRPQPERQQGTPLSEALTEVDPESRRMKHQQRIKG